MDIKEEVLGALGSERRNEKCAILPDDAADDGFEFMHPIFRIFVQTIAVHAFHHQKRNALRSLRRREDGIFRIAEISGEEERLAPGFRVKFYQSRNNDVSRNAE